MFGIFGVKSSYKVVPATKQLEEVRIEQGVNSILSSLFRDKENEFFDSSLNNHVKFLQNNIENQFFKLQTIIDNYDIIDLKEINLSFKDQVIIKT